MSALRLTADPPRSAALVRDPSPQLAAGEVTYLDRSPVDLSRAREQHAAYVRTLAALGLDIVTAPPLPEHPDGVFVEDAVVVVDHLAVLTRPGAASRRHEPASLRDLLQARGLQLATIDAEGTLDGGDVLAVGDTLYVGRSTRTSASGIAQLAALVAPLGRRVVTVDVREVLHLKTGVTALPDARLLRWPGSVDDAAFAGHTSLDAREPSGADVVVVGEVVVIAASAPRTAALLSQEGYDIRTVELSELEKLEAGPTCLSVLLPPPATV